MLGMKLIKKLEQNGFSNLEERERKYIVDYIIKEIRSNIEIGKR
jgi:hypothetical protein